MKYVLAALVCAALFVPTAGFASGPTVTTTSGTNTTVYSNGHHPTQIQHGDYNLSVVIQYGNNSATTVQNGTGNVAHVYQN
jgi:hypothetical protein